MTHILSIDLGKCKSMAELTVVPVGAIGTETSLTLNSQRWKLPGRRLVDLARLRTDPAIELIDDIIAAVRIGKHHLASDCKHKNEFRRLAIAALWDRVRIMVQAPTLDIRPQKAVPPVQGQRAE